MKRLLYLPLFAALLYGCGSSSYRIADPTPVLTVSFAATTCEFGQALSGRLAITQPDGDSEYALSALLREGSAEITIDGTKHPTSGAWTPLKARNAKIVIMPLKPDDVILTLQVRSAEGTLSNECRLEIEVAASDKLAATANCDSKVVNPVAGVLLPVRLSIRKADFPGSFKVRATVTRGKGSFLFDDHVINDTEIDLGSDATLLYRPTVLGEHLLAFQVSAGEETVTARAYVDVVKQVSVACDVTEGFTISGVGEYGTEGKSIILSLVNDANFNFEATAWHDNSGRLLASGATCPITLSMDCPNRIALSLKERTVDLQLSDWTEVPYDYIIQQNGKPVKKTVYDHRMQVIANYCASDPIKFYYEGSKYDVSVLPPAARWGAYGAALTPRTRSSSYIWCIYRPDMNGPYLRQADNPSLVFDYKSRSVRSASTRYCIIDPNIILQ